MVVTEVQQVPSRCVITGLVTDRCSPDKPGFRRKLQRSVVMDPMIIDAKIMASLELYLGSHIEDVSCMTVKFLNMFLTESPFLEVFEADNFILRNGKVLASWYVLSNPYLHRSYPI
jgi:hypothetical protein